MDKYEFNIKVEQIKKLVGKNDYDTAMKIADTIDWKRVRNTNLLSMVATIYEKNEDFQEAKEILLQAFERAPIGKRLLYKLAELAIKEGNIEEAEAYYKEFGDLASDDPRQQLLRFMILKAKGAPAQQLIHSLESYTSVELDEKWLYELAELYSLAGMPDRCVDTCDRIMLMFGLGKYVDKAMDLKIQYAPLTNYQMDLVENRDKYEAKLRAVEQEYSIGRRPNSEPEPELEPEEEYYEEEQESYQEPAIVFGENPGEDNLAARLQEAAVQETLAREMSKISYEEPVMLEEPKMERTRVLEDIRRVGRPVTAVPGPGSIYAPEEESLLYHSEPVIEEEEPEGPGMEETDIGGYYDGEAEYEASDDAIGQFPTTEDDFLDSGDQPEEDYGYEENDYNQPDGSLNSTLEEENAPYGDADILEFEDLCEEEEDDLEETPVQNHLMIEARTPEKGLQMAVEALKQIHNENNVKNPVAKITGTKLSSRGVLASADRLAGKDLVIEEAGDLTREALEELNELMDQDTSGMIVVLIDNPKQMETLHQEHPALASKFECIGSGEEAPIFSMRETVQKERPVRVVQKPALKPLPPAFNEKNSSEESSEDYGDQEYSYESASWQENEYGQAGAHENGSYGNGIYENGSYGNSSYENEAYEDGVDEDSDFYEEDEEFRPSVRDEEGPGFQGEEMDLDEFAQYACRYANEIDCSITGKSMLALYERIEIMEEDGLPLNRTNAESLIEEAADRAEKPNLGKRIKGLFSSKYDKDGLLVLKEEHFIY